MKFAYVVVTVFGDFEDRSLAVVGPFKNKRAADKYKRESSNMFKINGIIATMLVVSMFKPLVGSGYDGSGRK